MNNASQSFRFTTWICCPIITLCSGLLVLHFSTFIYTQENAISFYPWLDKKTLICQKSSDCAPPWVAYSRRSVLWLQMWTSQFIRMLLWREGGSQVNVTLMGPMKSHTCTPWNILATVCGLSLGCIFMCACVFVCVVGLSKKSLLRY